MQLLALIAENAIIREVRGGNYDLLVMGVSPRPGDQLFFGEVPADLLQRSPCSLVFVASEPGLTGPMGAGPIAVVGGRGLRPSAREVVGALDRIIR